MNEDIGKIKNSMKVIPQMQKLKAQKDDLYKEFKVLRDQGRVLSKKIEEEKNKMKKLYEKLDENRNKEKEEEEKKKNEIEEVDENGKPKKKKRPPTQGEIDIDNKKQGILKEIESKKSERSKLREEFKESMIKYEEQKFELAKIEFMRRVQKRLQREERKKQQEEENKKYREEEEKQRLEQLKTKYQEEINLCETLIRQLQTRKNTGQKEGENAQNQQEGDQKDEEAFKGEDLTVQFGKQQKYGEETVIRKKKNKGKKKTQSKKQVTGNPKMQVDLDTLQNFDKLKVLPPSNPSQIDKTIEQLEEKKKYFLEKREKEQQSAEESL